MMHRVGKNGGVNWGIALLPWAPKGSRSSGKVHSFGKREQAIKRNPNVPVVVRGWLYKQDSSGMRLWKRKWFVLADFCLFYYKDSREESVLCSIPLPSYVISPVGPEDYISRKYAFFKLATHWYAPHIYKREFQDWLARRSTLDADELLSADTQGDYEHLAEGYELGYTDVEPRPCTHQTI
ncbi:pleckstrin homology domain-containing family A member 7-like isoform X1 [Lates japonicus]|uniref:Pleckstrin homology domain-containing family A member 7-like isoform X1 n=1 Tax=Lates japonicus TaxID=270547 RepID=A0AAD3NKY8_LATJO|nr:pleckstrin homology domain-containing family A member 7-like isoform X1 [Lates japonicus]